MTTDEKDLVKKAEKTDLSDPDSVKKTLDGILGWVEKRKSVAQQPISSTSTAKPWGWVLGIIAAVLIFLALAFAAWQAWKKGREIAKLKHELDKRREEERQARVNAELSKLSSEREKYEKEAEQIRERIQETKGGILKLEAERLTAHAKIDKVTKWEDVDLLTKDDND